MKSRDLALGPATAAGRHTRRERIPQPRLERRVPYRVPCRVRLVNPTTGEVRTVLGETLNISRSGLSLQIGVDVAAGTWVETLVAHPNGDPMFLCGTVARCRQVLASNYEIGVRTRRPEAFV